MAMLKEIDFENFCKLHNQIYEDDKKSDCVEDVAQEYTRTLYNAFSESISLIRIFLTVPFCELPDENKQFVQNLIRTKGLPEKLDKMTPVLSLVGTSGIKPYWNDRRKSKDHIGIPLISADFIDSIPMMSRLLKQIGMGLDWIARGESKFIQDDAGSFKGAFYVRSANSETDSKGRKIIVDQNFVNENKIKSVFGLGGGYLGCSTFFTSIFFLRETIEENTVNWFRSHPSLFKAATIKFVNKKMIFSEHNHCS